jgi:hypothetical protein
MFKFEVLLIFMKFNSYTFSIDRNMHHHMCILITNFFYKIAKKRLHGGWTMSVEAMCRFFYTYVVLSTSSLCSATVLMMGPMFGVWAFNVSERVGGR